MSRYRLSTTALFTVSVTVEAPDAEAAIGRAPRSGDRWRIGDIVGDVDLDSGEVDVQLLDEGHAVLPDDFDDLGDP